MRGESRSLVQSGCLVKVSFPLLQQDKVTTITNYTKLKLLPAAGGAGGWAQRRQNWT